MNHSPSSIIPTIATTRRVIDRSRVVLPDPEFLLPETAQVLTMHPVEVRKIGEEWEATHARKPAARAASNKVHHPSLAGGFYDIGIFDARQLLCQRHPELWDVGFFVVTRL